MTVRRTIGFALSALGVIWALIGVWPLVATSTITTSDPLSAAATGMTFLVTAMMFFLPGVVIFALGLIVARKSSSGDRTRPSTRDRLARLDALLQDGAITPDEHARQRAALIRDL